MDWFDLNSWLPDKRDWLQVEVTSWCNAACSYCPRTVYRDTWKNRQMSPGTFRRLLPYFGKARLIYLQGWGEPLLSPHFFTMVALAKRAGCRVGTTTNGTLLDAPRMLQLVESGLDLVALSLAGVDAKNDAIRRGTSLKQVLEAIQALSRIKERLGSPTPVIHLAYMLLRSGLQDLERLPVMFKGSGLSEIVISTLDLVPSRDLEAEAVRPASSGEYAELRSRLEELARLGGKCGFAIHYQLQDPSSRRPTCTENVQQALVVSADGMVSPCVFTNLPVSGVSYFHKGQEYPYRQLFFGNVNERPLEKIWDQDAYKVFRHSFFDGRLAPPCRECSKL